MAWKLSDLLKKLSRKKGNSAVRRIREGPNWLKNRKSSTFKYGGPKSNGLSSILNGFNARIQNTPKKKRSFLQRLFGKKEEAINTGSITHKRSFLNRLFGRKSTIGRFGRTNLPGLKIEDIPDLEIGKGKGADRRRGKLLNFRRNDAKGSVNTENFINRIFILLNAITSENFILKDVYSKILHFDTETQTIGDFNKILASEEFIKFNGLDSNSDPLISGLNTREMWKNDEGKHITRKNTGTNMFRPKNVNRYTQYIRDGEFNTNSVNIMGIEFGLPDDTPIKGNKKLEKAIKNYQYNAYNELIAMIQISIGTLVVGAFEQHPAMKQTTVGKQIMELHDKDESLTKFMRDIGKSDIYDNPAFDRETWDKKLENLLRKFLPLKTVERVTQQFTDFTQTLSKLFILPIFLLINNTINIVFNQELVNKRLMPFSKSTFGVFAAAYMTAGLALQVVPPLVIGVLAITFIHFNYTYNHYKIGFWKRTKENLLDVYQVIFDKENAVSLKDADESGDINFRNMNKEQKRIFLEEGPKVVELSRDINSEEYVKSNTQIFDHYLRLLSGMTKEEIEKAGIWEQALLEKHEGCKKGRNRGEKVDCTYSEKEKEFLDSGSKMEDSMKQIVEDLDKDSQRNINRESDTSVKILRALPWLKW